ncbi:hypothetical protein [Tardiphaga sp.]|uniref:hypothetical protein n=1 Tax=Tardiphaga sp. TaxID=1926292 RepID=UPI00352B2B68
MSECDDLSVSVNRIVGATAEQLIVEINGERRPLAWTLVKTVHATIAVRDENMPIMAFEINEGRTRRSLLVGQVDGAWAELKAALHIGLPGAIPVEVWEQALIDLPVVLPVFRRDWNALGRRGTLSPAL